MTFPCFVRHDFLWIQSQVTTDRVQVGMGCKPSWRPVPWSSAPQGKSHNPPGSKEESKSLKSFQRFMVSAAETLVPFLLFSDLDQGILFVRYHIQVPKLRIPVRAPCSMICFLSFVWIYDRNSKSFGFENRLRPIRAMATANVNSNKWLKTFKTFTVLWTSDDALGAANPSNVLRSQARVHWLQLVRKTRNI